MKLSKLFPVGQRINCVHPFTGERTKATVTNYEMDNGFRADVETAVIARHDDGTIATLDRYSVESLNPVAVLDSLMSVEEAAERIGKSVAWVRAKAAEIGCHKLGRGTWVITPADLEKMQ